MQTETVDGAVLETWTPEEVARAMAAQEIVLIDVRSPQEYALERIESALLMPMSHFDVKALPGQGEKRIVFHCGSGKRSEKVAREALAAGAERIAHLGGGFGAWKEGGQPFIGTDMATGAPVRQTA